MNFIPDYIYYLAIFIIVVLASRQIGITAYKIHLPLITGFLLAGIIAGPYVLKILSKELVEKLFFLDEISLGFIAFAAGGELFIEDLKHRVKSITYITFGQIIITFIFVTTLLYLFSDFVPFIAQMNSAAKFSISMLAASILIARSPSSAIAVIKELRAKGPFTQTAIGVTVIIDVVVIFLFALCLSIVDSALHNIGIDFKFFAILLLELFLIITIAFILHLLLKLWLRFIKNQIILSAFILASGYMAFLLASYIRHNSSNLIGIELFLEPLLICMIASFLVTNFSNYRKEYSKMLHITGPGVYLIFFTLTGASLALDVFIQIWHIAIALFFVRILAIFVGSYIGGTAAGDRKRYNKYSWMSFITQAGVGLGLAKEIAVEFPGWGDSFATMIIAVIVLNQLIGPAFFKMALFKVKEAHVRGKNDSKNNLKKTVIFGIDGQSIALSMQLKSHEWDVILITQNRKQVDEEKYKNEKIIYLDELTYKNFQDIGCDTADSAVTMLSDDENYKICELLFEHFSDVTPIVFLNDRPNISKFKELGALIVARSTAIVSLLDHFVRSPSAASLLMGMNDDFEVEDIEVQNPNLYGLRLKNLHLPEDLHILSVQRSGKMLIVHDNIRFKIGDEITVIGPENSIDEVRFRFES